METRVSSATKEVIIGGNRPTVLIGERINPTGKKKMASALQTGDFDLVRQEALAQVRAGAKILDINVGVVGLDQIELLPRAVQAVMQVVDIPLSLDCNNPKALESAIKIYKGKPIINSVTGEERSLSEILPLVKSFGTAVIALTMDDDGIPNDVDRRVKIAHKIIERANTFGIPSVDVIVDCLVLMLQRKVGSC